MKTIEVLKEIKKFRPRGSGPLPRYSNFISNAEIAERAKVSLTYVHLVIKKKIKPQPRISKYYRVVKAINEIIEERKAKEKKNSGRKT